MTTPALRLTSLTAGYPGKDVVRDVSLELKPGGWLAIVGPNGAGKSTLLKAVAGVVRARGLMTVAGSSVDSLRRKQKARLIGYAPQHPALPDGLTVTDYALLGRTPHLGNLAREGATDLSIVEDVLARLDLATMADRRLRTLSGGERQRCVLARVLAQQATLLLLDEPTTGLDIGHAQTLLELIDSLRAASGVSVLSTLHDLGFAAQYADQLLLLDAGEQVAFGEPAEVLTPELIGKHYGAATELVTTKAGYQVLVPDRPARSD